MEFMHAFNTVVIFSILVMLILGLCILATIEMYDRLSGADAKRQAELARLRQLEDD